MLRAFGWELRFQSASSNSDKVYRVIVTHQLVITNYGRYGAHGQVQYNVLPNLGQVRHRAVKITNEKERKGYQESRPVTEFAIDLADYTDICNGDPSAKARARNRILSSFLAAAPELTSG